MPYIIGVDLGGTNLRVGLLDEKHLVHARYKCPTRVADGPKAILADIAAGVKDVLAQKGLAPADVLGIGVGAPGPLDGRTGVVLEAPNLKWNNVPVAAILAREAGIQVQIENDANAAGWGEYWAGAGLGSRSMVMFTLGTGVGGAIIHQGELIRGPDWTAGELGHMVVVAGGRTCGCGNHGCIEAYASATATVARFREAMRFGWHTALAERKDFTCADIFDAALDGDNLAKHIVAETGRYLGIIAANMANALNPERCVFSGGMIQAGPILFDAIRESAREHSFQAPGKRMQILPAALGADAGLIGAAGVALHAFADPAAAAGSDATEGTP